MSVKIKLTFMPDCQGCRRTHVLKVVAFFLDKMMDLDTDSSQFDS